MHLGKVTGFVLWALVLELLLVATAAPGLVFVTLLAPEASNLPLLALGLVPVGPAFSAALFAWRAYERDEDPAPARAFWRGYRLNALDVLRLWVPALVVLTVIGINLANLAAVPGGELLGPLLWVLLVIVAVWSGHMLVLASLFSFRTRDVARLAAFFVATRPLVSLGYVALLVCGGALVLAWGDWVLALTASLLALLVLRYARPVIADVESRFTTPAP